MVSGQFRALGQDTKKSKRGLVERGAWWYKPLILAPWRQRQADLSDFEANLTYKVSARTARVM